jgi:RNA polymerase II subunit A-like phosphatase
VVLDIDNTLLHSTEAPAGVEAQPAGGVHSFLLAKPHHGGTSRYHVRTRHGLHSFLRELQDFADVHIYTMGSKSYTREVLDAIDPHIKLVAGRVFCREDGRPDNFHKSLTHLQSSTAVRRPL